MIINTKRPIYSLHKHLLKKSSAEKSKAKRLEVLRMEKQKRQNDAELLIQVLKDRYFLQTKNMEIIDNFPANFI